MGKKVVALILTFAMALSLPVSGASALADDMKNGFELTPLISDGTGVAPESAFTLVSEKEVNLEDLAKALSIDGEPAPTIEPMEEANRFKVTPSRMLQENSLYTFRLSLEEEVSWTFQTRKEFKILGSLPGNESNRVPADSGIEIYFSHENVEEMTQYFEIQPPVEGRFEVHKKTVVFVPKELKKGTLYTVKIKKGIGIKGTGRKLKEDYVFSFETEYGVEQQDPDRIKGIFIYNTSLFDYTPNEQCYVPFHYYINKDTYKENQVTIKTKVYAYGDFPSFFEALKQKQSIPLWASRSYLNQHLPAGELQEVLGFDQTIDTTGRYDNDHIKIPEALPQGYYLLDSTWEDVRFQTLLQVTNTGIYMMKGTNKTLLWIHDFSTQKPLDGASVQVDGQEDTYYSDAEGIITFDTVEPEGDRYTYHRGAGYVKVTTHEGVSSVISDESYYYWGSNEYWRYLFTDRGMYKPDDTIHLWGYLEKRYGDEEINDITLELTTGYFSELPIIKQQVKIQNGYYEAQLKLPMLDQGGYSLLVKKGDEVVQNQYIRIQDYVKPSYKIDVTKDKEAIFLGEKVNFTVQAAFFEGTGVSNLKIESFFNEYYLNRQNNMVSASTDAKGNVTIPYVPIVPETVKGVQGDYTVEMEVRATLPEMGEMYESEDVRVFVNDIHVDASGEIKDGKGSISAKVNQVVLDRLNEGTAKDYNDYLGEAVEGKALTGTIYQNSYIKKENGEYYDFINKVTRKSYRYDRVQTPIKDFSMTTKEDGVADFTFDAPPNGNSYYTAEFSCMDGLGRKIEYHLYIGEYYEAPEWEETDVYYSLEGGKESYGLGEKVELVFKKGEEVLPEGKYLFIKAQNGIQDYVLSEEPTYTTEYGEKDIPNVGITGVYFDGKMYHMSSNTVDVSLKIEEKELTLEAQMDKQSYRPGEDAVVKIYAKNKDGDPVRAFVNVSIVDEAFFALVPQSANTLQELYHPVGLGILLEKKSHEYSRNDLDGLGGSDDYSKEAPAEFSRNGSANQVRSEFRDTAHFESVMTNEQGEGEVRFKLPDNVTSWRVTMTAISEDRQAGSNQVNMNVTLPFFIHYSLNTTYLEGDQPVLGVNAYGNSLKEGGLVRFEAWDSRKPEQKVSVVGKAFERVNIPLWKMSQGSFDLIIKAYTNEGLSDAVQHKVKVVPSYYQMEKADYYDLAPGTKIAGGASGNTTMVFQERNRGMFFGPLMRLYYSDGNRIDQKLSVNGAAELIQKHFKECPAGVEVSPVLFKEYQKKDGGLSLLPYASSDVELSAKLSTLVKDKVDLFRLKKYFYGILDQEAPENKAMVLYGLATMKEPVLLELEKIAEVDNLSLKAWIYLGLAYSELGDRLKAEAIYANKVHPLIEAQKPYYRINMGVDKDDILELTALCAVLASKLDKEEKAGLYAYCVKNGTKDILVYAEMLMYIEEEIGKYSEEDSVFTYRFKGEEKKVDFKDRRVYIIEIASQDVPAFEVIDVQGGVTAVSIYKEDVLGIQQSNTDISVKREYLHIDGRPLASNTLRQGDVIKVQIQCSMGQKAMDGSYQITDYLPSGLKPLENGYNMGWYYRYSDGQKVKFYVYNSRHWDAEDKVLEYYARVISPGTYTAQGTSVQSIDSRTIINVGETQSIYIDSNGDKISTPIDPNAVKVELDGILLIFDIQPVIQDGRTLVPMRSIFEAMGADVEWDAETKTVTGTKGGKKVVLNINSSLALANGEHIQLDVPATIIGNRTFVPARFISESLGAEVQWSQARRTVLIKAQ